MNRNADILNELKTLDTILAYMPCTVPYSVPEGYLDLLATALQQGVHFSEADEPIGVHLPKELPFEVSAGYFTGLAEKLKDASVSNLKEGINAPFAIPPGYLENLPQILLSATKEDDLRTEKPRFIQLHPHWSRIVRMAAAAVVVLGIGFGSYRYLHPATPERMVAKQLSKLDGATINGYIEQHVDDFDAESLEAAVAAAHTELPASVSSLDAAEIQEYFQESGEAVPLAKDEAL